MAAHEKLTRHAPEPSDACLFYLSVWAIAKAATAGCRCVASFGYLLYRLKLKASRCLQNLGQFAIRNVGLLELDSVRESDEALVGQHRQDDLLIRVVLFVDDVKIFPVSLAYLPCVKR